MERTLQQDYEIKTKDADMKLSIVIPMYGVEKYIEKCLMSCINQDINLGYDYEIICINDGTKDKSSEIAKQIAANYDGVQVIDQENSGLSVARNNGLLIAKGDYVWFVDSDDWINGGCLGRITRKLDNDIDILQLQYRWVYDDESKSFDEPFTQINGIQTGRDVTLHGGLPAPAQFSIYRREFLLENKLEFVKGIYHEDSEFKPRAVYFARKIASDDEISYNYYQRPTGSIMSSFSLKRAKDMLYVNNNLYKFSECLDEDVKKAIYLKIGLNLNSLFFGYCTLSSENKKAVRILLSNNKHLFKCMIHCPNAKYRIEGYLFSISINFTLIFYKLLKR